MSEYRRTVDDFGQRAHAFEQEMERLGRATRWRVRIAKLAGALICAALSAAAATAVLKAFGA